MPTANTLGRDVQKKKKSTTSKTPSKLAPPPPSFKSSEYVQDSDEEPENSENENQSDSDAESFPSNPADILSKTNGKLPCPAGSSSSSENESDSEKSGSDADHEEGEENPLAVMKQPVARPSEKSTASSRPSVVTFQKPPPYKAPAGFEKVSVDGTPKAGHMLKKSSLEGKQIWYFTAPSSLPISSLGQISLKDATDGKPIVNHKSMEYGFVRDSAEDKTYTKIMVPNGSDNGYRMAKSSINQILHLQQIVKLPGVHTSNSIAASSSKATVAAKKPIRQQPQGLKMRFRPMGFGDGDTGNIGSSSSSVDSSIEKGTDEERDTPPAATFRKPITVASDSSETDDSSEDSESDEESSLSDAEMTEAPPLLTKPVSKEKENKTPSAVPSSHEVTKGSLKRKHSGEEDRKTKHSSSRSSSIDDRELKRLKKTQIESQRSLGDKASMLIEPRHGSLKNSLKLEINSPQNTPIRPPKSTTLNSSSPSRPKVSLDKNGRDSRERVRSKKRDRSEPVTPFRKSDVSLQDLTKATDPSLTGEERRKKIKKLKNKE